MPYDSAVDVSRLEPARSGDARTESAVFVHTVNLCGRRLLQVERLKGYLLANGYRLVPGAATADDILLVGCAFNGHTEEVSAGVFADHRRRLREGQRLFLLEGIADICGDALVRDGQCEDSFVIPTTSFDRLDRHFARRVRFADTPEANIPGQYDGVSPAERNGFALAPAPSGNAVFSIQVATGCRDDCTYCGDKPIVGALSSRPVEAVIAQARRAAALGYRAVELIGDDVGCYGLDIGKDLPSLLRQIAAEPGIERISLLEINVKYLTRYEAFLHEFLPSRTLRKMAVAFQSGNDRILGLMARGYGASDVRRIATLLSTFGVWTHAHVIVGFPTETDAEFRQSYEMLLDGGFESATLFLYQDRPGTPASVLYPKVPDAWKRRRLDEARERLSRAGFSTNAREDKLQVCRVPSPI